MPMAWVQTLALPLASCVILGNLLNCSGPHVLIYNVQSCMLTLFVKCLVFEIKQALRECLLLLIACHLHALCLCLGSQFTSTGFRSGKESWHTASLQQGLIRREGWGLSLRDAPLLPGAV